MELHPSLVAGQSELALAQANDRECSLANVGRSVTIFRLGETCGWV